MKANKAIVTLAVGDHYFANWKKTCDANWSAYAQKYGYDVICLDQPLDSSERARQRSVSWQKCLILSRPSLQSYKQVVWLDSDIVINPATAPDIVDSVPTDKVGAVEQPEFTNAYADVGREFTERVRKLWPNAIINLTAREYYMNYGLGDDCDRVLNAGVLVLSPKHHRALLEKVYYGYEEKGGLEWQMEMRPLSYELVRAGLVHWLDPRFNLLWSFQKIMYYPFLLEPERTDFISRLRRRLSRLFGSSTFIKMHTACVNAAFRSSFFLHFGGPNASDMGLVGPCALAPESSQLGRQTPSHTSPRSESLRSPSAFQQPRILE